MRKLSLFLFILLAALLVTSCGEDRGVDPQTTGTSLTDIDPEMLAGELVMASGWEFDSEVELPEKFTLLEDKGARCHILDFEREVITDDIAHYSFIVQVGPGEHDKIGLHRVVKECRPGHPVRARTSIFLQHGDIKDFVGMFLPGLNSPRQADDRGFAVHLAAAGIDVWGIDQAWALVPAEVTEHDFMADWGMARAIGDLETGLAVARTLRRFTGNGWRKMQLLGYSSGAATGFVYLGRESQRPRGRRHVNAFIAADYGLVSNDQDWQDLLCLDVEAIQGDLDQGIYGFYNPFPFFGPPALADPDSPCEIPGFEGFTNLQAALALGVYPAYAGASYHFLAGIFDNDGVPTGLQYTPVDDWIDFMVYAPPYEANQFMLDYSEVICSPEAVPWDDNLGDITVPIFWLEAAGGAAPMIRHTIDVVGSDVTELIISFHPPEEVLLDFAHIDLFIGFDAPTLAWNPMLDWIEDQGWQ